MEITARVPRLVTSLMSFIELSVVANHGQVVLVDVQGVAAPV